MRPGRSGPSTARWGSSGAREGRHHGAGGRHGRRAERGPAGRQDLLVLGARLLLQLRHHVRIADAEEGAHLVPGPEVGLLLVPRPGDAELLEHFEHRHREGQEGAEQVLLVERDVMALARARSDEAQLARLPTGLR